MRAWLLNQSFKNQLLSFFLIICTQICSVSNYNCSTEANVLFSCHACQRSWFRYVESDNTYFKFALIRRYFTFHDRGGVSPKSLPLSCYFTAFLSVIIEETTQIPKFLVVLLQTLVHFLQTPYLQKMYLIIKQMSLKMRISSWHPQVKAEVLSLLTRALDWKLVY